MTLGRDVEAAKFGFFLTDPAQWLDPRRRFTLSTDEIAAINPNTKTAPVFRSRRDAELTAKIYARVPVLVNEGEGPARQQSGAPAFTPHLAHVRGLRMVSRRNPLRQGASFRREGPLRRSAGHQRTLRHRSTKPRWSTISIIVGPPTKAAATVARDLDASEKGDPQFESTTRYWVPEEEVENRLREKGWTKAWLFGWRNITRSTDERTLIAAAFPRSAAGHSLPLFLPVKSEPCQIVALQANLASLILDYIAATKAERH